MLTVTIAVLLLRWAPPPTSAFMLQQRLAGATVDYRWVPLDREGFFTIR